MGERSLHRGAAGTSRRGLLTGLAVTAVAVMVSRPAAAAMAAGRAIPTLNFLAATAKLTGIALDRSYMQMADTVWSLLEQEGVSERRLRRLVQVVNSTPESRLAIVLETLGLTKAARAVMTAWYTGQVEVPRRSLSDPRIRRLTGGAVVPGSSKTVTLVFNYDEALVWRACSFTKASATCGGPFGYWHDAPQA